MKPLQIIITLCTIFLLCTDCNGSDNECAPLSDVAHIIDKNPQEALSLLEHISPKCIYNYNVDEYLHFILFLTQAMHMNDRSITGDSMILIAQRHFVKKQDYELIARASYYSAEYCYEFKQNNKAMEYAYTALRAAEKAGNELFVAKSAYWLGQYHYNEQEWYAANHYCQKALNLCNILPDSTACIIELNEYLGKINESLGNLEQACEYFNDGLNIAKKQEDKIHEARFLKEKGIIHAKRKEYVQARQCLDRALVIPSTLEDSLCIYLGYSILYREMNCLDSALRYSNKVSLISQDMTDSYILKNISREFCNYQIQYGQTISEIVYHLLMEEIQQVYIQGDVVKKRIKEFVMWRKRAEPYRQIVVKEYTRKTNIIFFSIFIGIPLLIAIGSNWYWIMERYKRIHEKKRLKKCCRKDMLLDGLRKTAEEADALYIEKRAFDKYPEWRETQALHNEFCSRMAERMRIEAEKQQNIENTFVEFTTEMWCIMYMSRLKLSDKTMGWLLGYRYKAYKFVKRRKEQMQEIWEKSARKDAN